MTTPPTPGTANLGFAFDQRFEDLYNDGDDHGLAPVDAATIMIMNAINSASEPMAPFTN